MNPITTSTAPPTTTPTNLRVRIGEHRDARWTGVDSYVCLVCGLTGTRDALDDRLCKREAS